MTPPFYEVMISPIGNKSWRMGSAQWKPHSFGIVNGWLRADLKQNKMMPEVRYSPSSSTTHPRKRLFPFGIVLEGSYTNTVWGFLQIKFFSTEWTHIHEWFCPMKNGTNYVNIPAKERGGALVVFGSLLRALKTKWISSDSFEWFVEKWISIDS